ncbi:MAG TPA: zinc metallopeptidase [Synergistales bacterium]|nr:zinc metallopeptidase [Synergistaceae bacterium]HQO83303.1 zinc metallopeptidase [Synergistales bacterium]
MFPFFFDPTFIVLIPALILAVWAQTRVKSAFHRYSKVRARRGVTARDAVRAILDSNGLNSVPVERVPGALTDHYDPRKKVLRLSESVYGSPSIAAIGVAAHEAGHAIQDARGYAPLKLRNAFVPVASLGSSLALPLFFIGFLFANPTMMDLGIIFFAAVLLFHLVTLPVELDASKRALSILSDSGLLASDEIGGAKAVLNAAALTYVAATLMSALQLVRLFLLRGMRNR